MSSRDRTAPAFQRINPPNCASLNSSFSIRNLLNLPEENAEECTPSSNDASPSNNRPVSLPLVPRVVRPPVQYYDDDNSPRSSLFNLEVLRFARSLHPSSQIGYLDNYGRFPLGISSFHKYQRKKKERPLFSSRQVQTMEKEFAQQRYVTEDKRAQLSSELNLTETQVKTWFQNRRTKWKKETRDAKDTSGSILTERRSQQGIGQVLLGVQGNSLHQNSCLRYQFGFIPQYNETPIFRVTNSSTSASFVAKSKALQ